MAQIEWGEPFDAGRDQIRIVGKIGDIEVAHISPDRSQKGDRWWVVMYIKPLPYSLDIMTYRSKASERQAKATAQRVLNGFLKILNGGRR